MKKLPKPEFQLGEEVWAVVYHNNSVDLVKDTITEISLSNIQGRNFEYKIDNVHTCYFFKLDKKKDAIKKMKECIASNIKRLKWLLNRHELIDRELDILCKDEGTDFWRD